MSGAFVWRTGSQGDELKCRVEWFDEDNIKQLTDIAVRVDERDKPRTLASIVNGVKVAEIERGNR